MKMVNCLEYPVSKLICVFLTLKIILIIKKRYYRIVKEYFANKTILKRKYFKKIYQAKKEKSALDARKIRKNVK